MLGGQGQGQGLRADGGAPTEAAEARGPADDVRGGKGGGGAEPEPEPEPPPPRPGSEGGRTAASPSPPPPIFSLLSPLSPDGFSPTMGDFYDPEHPTPE